MVTMLRRAALRMLAIAAVQPGGLDAQTGSTQSGDSVSRQLKTVRVTEARSTAEVGGATAVIVATGELRSSPAPLLHQALRESPFVQVRQNSRGEMELSVRGSASRQAAVVVDGVPLSIGWDNRTDVSLVPITGSEEIVVVRGLGSILGGPNSLGGTIAISQGASAAPAGTRRAWGGMGVDANAAFVLTLGGSRTSAVAGGLLTIRGGVAHRDQDGVTLPAGVTDPTSRHGLRTNSDLTESDAFASFRWNDRRGRSLGLSASGFNAERGVPPEEHIKEPRLWRYPYHTRGVVALSGGIGAFATPWGTGVLDWAAGYNAGRTKIETFTDRTYTVVDDVELGDERTFTARVQARHTLPHNATLATAVTLANVRYIETLVPDPGAHYRQVLWSAGAEVEAPVGTQSTLSAGAVFDQASTPESGGRTPRQDAFDNVGWRAGISHDLNEVWRVHTSASQRSRFPSLRELYSGALNRFTPNPALKPETLVGLEGGVTFHGPLGAVPDATVQVTGFHHRLDDAVVRITLANTTRFMRVNRDRIASTGAEFIAGFVFGRNGERAVSLSGDALVQRVRLYDHTADAERHPENDPEVRGTVSMRLPLPMLARATAALRYTGRQYCLNADTGNEMELFGKATSNFGVERTFAVASSGPFRALRALFSLDNVGNAAVYDQCGLPQPGRTLRLMVTFR